LAPAGPDAGSDTERKPAQNLRIAASRTSRTSLTQTDPILTFAPLVEQTVVRERNVVPVGTSPTFLRAAYVNGRR